MNAPIGVAVIGAGMIAATHVGAVEATAGLELVAIGSRTAERARAFVDRLGSGTVRPDVTVGTLEDVLNDARVGLVSVATPTGTHVELGTRVLAAGHHLLVEKPLDVDLERTLEFERTAAEAEQAGLVTSVVSQQRFGAAAESIAQDLAKGRFGRVTSGVATVGWWRSQAYYDQADWRGTWAGDGGALMNQGIHALDLLIWFLGSPVRTFASSARLAHDRIEVEDTLAAVIEFASGALATVHVTTAAYPGLPARIEVRGTRGTAVLDHDVLSYLHLGSGTDAGDLGLYGASNQAPQEVSAVPKLDASRAAAGHARQFADVAAAIRDGSRPRMTVQDAVVTLRTIHAIYRSAATGTPVRLDR